MAKEQHGIWKKKIKIFKLSDSEKPAAKRLKLIEREAPTEIGQLIWVSDSYPIDRGFSLP